MAKFALGNHRVVTDDGTLTYDGLACARQDGGIFYLEDGDNCPVLVVPTARLKGYAVGVFATMEFGGIPRRPPPQMG